MFLKLFCLYTCKFNPEKKIIRARHCSKRIKQFLSEILNISLLRFENSW